MYARMCRSHCRVHGNSLIVRDAKGTEQTHIRIDKPTEAVVALTAIWEEAAKIAQRKVDAAVDE